MKIIKSENIEPSFYEITDWNKPKESARPEYHNGMYIAIRDTMIVHPWLYDKMSNQ